MDKNLFLERWGDQRCGETADGAPILESWCCHGTRGAISSLSARNKRELALSLGVPAPDSGLPGAWDDKLDPQRVVPILWTDESLDRHGTVFRAGGWDFRNFERNPQSFYNHTMPVGLVLKQQRVRVKGPDGRGRPGWVGHTLFTRSDVDPDGTGPVAESVYRRWLAGRLRAASHHFVAHDYRVATEEDLKSLGIRQAESGGDVWLIERAELMELGPVDLGSNPAAVQRNLGVSPDQMRDAVLAEMRTLSETRVLGRSGLRAAYGDEMASILKEDGWDAQEDQADLDADEILRVAEKVNAAVERILSAKANVLVPAETEEYRTVVKFREYPVSEKKWDASAAKKRTKAWATREDGTIDFERFARMFGWFDGDNPEKVGSYKLPHHDLEGDAVVTPKRGVIAAMTALLGGRGGVDLPVEDRKGVYNHLAKHYAQWGGEPPAFREVSAQTEDLSAICADLRDALEAAEGPEVLEVNGKHYVEIEDKQRWERALQALLDATHAIREALPSTDTDGSAKRTEITAEFRAEIAELREDMASVRGLLESCVHDFAARGAGNGALDAAEYADELLGADDLARVATRVSQVAEQLGG